MWRCEQTHQSKLSPLKLCQDGNTQCAVLNADPVAFHARGEGDTPHSSTQTPEAGSSEYWETGRNRTGGRVDGRGRAGGRAGQNQKMARGVRWPARGKEQGARGRAREGAGRGRAGRYSSTYLAMGFAYVRAGTRVLTTMQMRTSVCFASAEPMAWICAASSRCAVAKVRAVSTRILGKTMRDAVGSQERWGKAARAYPRSWYLPWG